MVLEHWIATCKRLEVDPYFTPCAKLKSGSTSYMQSQNYKLLEKNTRVDIHGLEFGMNSETPKAWQKKTKLDFINGEGNGTPLQYSCLENPMDGGAWKAAVHGVAEGRTRLSDFTFTFQFHALEKEMATHSSVLAWRIPGTGEPGGLPSMGSHRVRHDWSDLAAAAAAAAAESSFTPVGN